MANVIRYRQSVNTTAFSLDDELALLPIKIVQRQAYDLATSQAQSS
jgi:hypothetical protein